MKVFSSIDRGGRYAYASQPAIGQWNMARLAEALLPLLDKRMDGFGELFRALSFTEIGTSTLQSRAFAGLANAVGPWVAPAFLVGAWSRRP